jgi:hypothetical protein
MQWRFWSPHVHFRSAQISENSRGNCTVQQPQEEQSPNKLPAGRRVTRVELLRAERNIPFHATGESVEFTIPSVTDYEVAALYTS